MENKTDFILAAIDEMIDNFRETPHFDVYTFLKIHSAPKNILTELELYYSPYLSELELAKSRECEQTNEAYKHMRKGELTTLIKCANSILIDGQRYKDFLTAKAPKKKARKSKIIDVAKHIAPMAENSDLKIVSVNPADVVGASLAYLYLIKYNKMIEAHASDEKGLTFSGKSLINFSLDKSSKKSIRTGKKELHTFAKNGKVTCRRMYEAYTGKPQKLTSPRININSQVAILRVFS